MATNSTRALRSALADGNVDCEAPQSFNEQFDLLDKDGNGTLDRNEAYQLAQLWKTQRDTANKLKGYMAGIIAVATLIIVLLAGATFGATFVAVAANKETSVASSGAFMSKDGLRELSTHAKGQHVNALKTSDEPVCIHSLEHEEIKAGVLSGEKVVLDIETEGTGTHEVKVFDGQGAYITEDRTCYNVDDPDKIFCLEKADCATEAHRKLWESRGLSVQRELHAGHGITVEHTHESNWRGDVTYKQVCSSSASTNNCNQRWAGGCGNNCYPCGTKGYKIQGRGAGAFCDYSCHAQSTMNGLYTSRDACVTAKDSRRA